MDVVPEPRYGEAVREWTLPIDTGEVPENGTHFDVIVVGGGPGGSAAASYNAMNGCKVLLIEKGIWPRDKACGDAVGGKSLTHVEELGVKEMIEATPHFRVDSIVFGSANGSQIRVMLPEESYEKMQAGYALPRIQFDYMMFKRATELVLESGGSVIQGFAVTEVRHESEAGDARIIGVTGKFGGMRSEGPDYSFDAPLTVGAGGYNCPVATMVCEGVHGEPMRDDEHYCGAYREYWENVEGFSGTSGPIEIHFVEGVIPGYFWLFPVSEGVVNVGIGMVIAEQRKQKGIQRSIRKMQKFVTEDHPQFKRRFANARLVPGSGMGWQLPFGSPRKNAPSFQPRRSAMAGAMCIGDAASLVDPFSGEGIGNALMTAKMTSKYFDREAHSDGFPENLAVEYMTEIWDSLGGELTNSYHLQKLVKWKRLMNWFVKRSAKKKEIRDMMTEMIASKETQTVLWSPWFLAKTLLLP